MAEAADYFDPVRRPPGVPPGAEGALAALCGEGISREQAAFAAFVMSVAGVFTGPQADSWLDTFVPGWAADEAGHVRRECRNRFLRPLFHPRFRGGKALVSTHGIGRGREFAHFHYKGAYRVLGNPDSRYRRRPGPGVILQRLLLLDFVLEHLPGLTWYGSMQQKLALFDALGVPRDALPSRRYESGGGAPPTTQYFVDTMPIGVGDWRLVFPVAFADDRTVAAALKRLESYAALWRELRRLGLLVEVGVVLQRIDAGEWTRRAGTYAHGETPADRERLLDQVERYLIERLSQNGEPAVERTYGGPAGVSRRLADLRANLGAPAPRGEPMATDVWFADRFSTGAWGVPIPLGTQVT